MKIIQGALTLFTLTSSVGASRVGKPRGKLSAPHKKRHVSRPHLKINPAASKDLARSAAVSAHATTTKVGAETVDSPTIDGYTFSGVGCCKNAKRTFYDWNTVSSGATVNECAAACEESYSSNESFVGVNINLVWRGASNCNCMSDPGGNGIITSTDTVD